jgi:hypothetical protein
MHILEAWAWALLVAYGLWAFSEMLEIVLREDNMPVAVITEPSERRDLKTLPEGFVVVKRMTYGQHLYRRTISTKFLMMDEKKTQGAIGEVKTMEEAVAFWEFANLVEDHNLTDEQGRKLNFMDPNDVKRISSKIGDEINTIIDELNNFKDEVEQGNSPGASAPSSSSTVPTTVETS